MKLGAPLSETFEDPALWAQAVRRGGYAAAYSPLGPGTTADVISAYVQTAKAAGIIIAEVGAWGNPIDPDPVKGRAAVRHAQECLGLAEQLGARCCVNITGSRHPAKWDGPHPENFLPATFDLIVDTTREIIDAVDPTRTFYALETMPWIFPSSPDEYLDLIRAIDRPGLAVHLDPVNMINSPMRCYRNGDFIRDCFRKLGTHIKSCHAKDIVLRENLTVHLDECRPGTGCLDYGAFLQELAQLPSDTPLLLEHLPAEDYPAAAASIREVARSLAIKLDD